MWFAFALIGFIVAVFAFFMMLLEEYMIKVKAEVFQYLVTGISTKALSAFFFYLTFSILFASAAAMLTVYIAPKATGSGIPEMIGCLNGVNVQSYLTPTVLIVKAIGVVLAIAGTLVVGKEGPLAHIGAGVAIMILFAPIETQFEEFRTA